MKILSVNWRLIPFLLGREVYCHSIKIVFFIVLVQNITESQRITRQHVMDNRSFLYLVKYQLLDFF